MIGIGSMMKMVRGSGIGPDELAEILGAAGVELTISQPAPDLAAFQPLAEAASLPSSKMIGLDGRMKDGSRVKALLVMLPADRKTQAV